MVTPHNDVVEVIFIRFGVIVIATVPNIYILQSAKCNFGLYILVFSNTIPKSHDN